MIYIDQLNDERQSYTQIGNLKLGKQQIEKRIIIPHKPSATKEKEQWLQSYI